MKNCDMCGTKIIDGKCSYGEWKSAEEMQNCPMKKAIEKFHIMNQKKMQEEVTRLVPEFKRCMLDLEEKYDIRAVIHAALCYSIGSLKDMGGSVENILTYVEEILKQ